MATIPRQSGFLRVDDLGADTASNPLYGSRSRNGSRLLVFLFRFVLLVCCGHSLLVFPFSQDAGHSLGKITYRRPGFRNQDSEKLKTPKNQKINTSQTVHCIL